MVEFCGCDEDWLELRLGGGILWIWRENLWLWISSSGKSHSLLLTSRKVHLGTKIFGMCQYLQISSNVQKCWPWLKNEDIFKYSPPVLRSGFCPQREEGRDQELGQNTPKPALQSSENLNYALNRWNLLNIFLGDIWCGPGCTSWCPPSDQKGCCLCKYNLNPNSKHIGRIPHLTVRFWIQGCWLT